MSKGDHENVHDRSISAQKNHENLCQKKKKYFILRNLLLRTISGAANKYLAISLHLDIAMHRTSKYERKKN